VQIGRDTGCRIQDAGYRMQDTGCRLQDTGFSSGFVNCQLFIVNCSCLPQLPTDSVPFKLIQVLFTYFFYRLAECVLTVEEYDWILFKVFGDVC
jgi:hypothetical protein